MTQINTKLVAFSLLAPERIFIFKGRPAKAVVMAKLAQAVCATLNVLDAQDVLAQVLRREEGVSTTLDTGLSFPHVRLEETPIFRAALAIVPDGVTTTGASTTEIKAIFFFISPAKPAFFQQHLHVLASLAETFKPETLVCLSACSTPQEVLDILAAK